MGNSPREKCKQLRNIYIFFSLTSNLRNENGHNAMPFFYLPDWQRKISSVAKNVGNNIERIPANGAQSPWTQNPLCNGFWLPFFREQSSYRRQHLLEKSSKIYERRSLQLSYNSVNLRLARISCQTVKFQFPFLILKYPFLRHKS